MNTSCTISYANFMKFGYPKRIYLQDLVNVCKELENNLKTISIKQSNFYSKVLLSIGFKLKDFKMGNNAIFFRAEKFHLLEKIFSETASFSEQSDLDESDSDESL